VSRSGLFLRLFPIALLIVTCLYQPRLRAAEMRPYAGIGILLLLIDSDEITQPPTPLPLYDDPSIYRLGMLDIAKVPRHEWIFGSDGASIPLIVVARKGEWSRVAYDDAGREAWINAGRRGAYYPWDGFLKDRSGFLLPGLQKRFYQFFREPGIEPLASLPPGQLFRIDRIDGDWIRLEAADRTLGGWLRWRDEDGRLLIGCERGRDLPVRQ